MNSRGKLPHTPIVTLLLFIVLSSTTPVRAQDQNLHTLVGTMTSAACFWFPATADWVCGTSIELKAPAPHFDNLHSTTIQMELEGEAVGQSGILGETVGFPRKVMVLYWLEAGGVDYERLIWRPEAHAYYVIDLGPT